LKNLYVGNLPHSTNESELRGLFQPHGEVEKVSMVTDRETGRSRGFAFVEMTNNEEAEKAIAALNGTELGGRALTINEAKPKTDRPRSGGGGGGGKRFGGGGGGGGKGGSGGGGRDDYRGQARQPREPRW
jgi:RNA recognition motif-containing protein